MEKQLERLENKFIDFRNQFTKDLHEEFKAFLNLHPCIEEVNIESQQNYIQFGLMFKFDDDDNSEAKNQFGHGLVFPSDLKPSILPTANISLLTEEQVLALNEIDKVVDIYNKMFFLSLFGEEFVISISQDQINVQYWTAC